MAQELLKDKVVSDISKKKHRKPTFTCSRCRKEDDGHPWTCYGCETRLCGTCVGRYHRVCVKCDASLEFKEESADPATTWTTEYHMVHLTRAKLRSLSKATAPVSIWIKLSSGIRVEVQLTARPQRATTFIAKAEWTSFTKPNGQVAELWGTFDNINVRPRLTGEDEAYAEERGLYAAGNIEDGVSTFSVTEIEFQPKEDDDEQDFVDDLCLPSQTWLTVDVATNTKYIDRLQRKSD